MAAALGAPLVGRRATNLQLDHPEETLANVRQLIARTRLAA
jgi:hypothetical protein